MNHESKLNFLFDGKFSEKQCHVVLDTGATISVVSAKLVKDSVDCRKVDSHSHSQSQKPTSFCSFILIDTVGVIQPLIHGHCDGRDNINILTQKENKRNFIY